MNNPDTKHLTSKDIARYAGRIAPWATVAGIGVAMIGIQVGSHPIPGSEAASGTTPKPNNNDFAQPHIGGAQAASGRIEGNSRQITITNPVDGTQITADVAEAQRLQTIPEGGLTIPTFINGGKKAANVEELVNRFRTPNSREWQALDILGYDPASTEVGLDHLVPFNQIKEATASLNNLWKSIISLCSPDKFTKTTFVNPKTGLVDTFEARYTNEAGNSRLGVFPADYKAWIITAQKKLHSLSGGASFKSLSFSIMASGDEDRDAIPVDEPCDNPKLCPPGKNPSPTPTPTSTTEASPSPTPTIELTPTITVVPTIPSKPRPNSLYVCLDNGQYGELSFESALDLALAAAERHQIPYTGRTAKSDFGSYGDLSAFLKQFCIQTPTPTATETATPTDTPTPHHDNPGNPSNPENPAPTASVTPTPTATATATNTITVVVTPRPDTSPQPPVIPSPVVPRPSDVPQPIATEGRYSPTPTKPAANTATAVVVVTPRPETSPQPVVPPSPAATARPVSTPQPVATEGRLVTQPTPNSVTVATAVPRATTAPSR